MENENKKYVITIDGPDCSGKTTLWKKVVLDGKLKEVQIRGIVSNIAYALKYNRDVDELINLYNENPVNYVVYLLNPINDKKLEMLYNRCRNNIYNNDYIINELKDASNTWIDINYFDRAINILKEKYKGDIKIVKSNDNQLEQFYNDVNNFELETLDNIKIFGPIKLLRTSIDNFEAEAKKASEFKYIVFNKIISGKEAFENLYNGLDEEHQELVGKLFDLSDGSIDEVEIYDTLEEKTPECLADYLDNYDFRVTVLASTRLETNCEFYINLKDMKNYDTFEDLIYDDSNYYDDIIDNLKNEVDYAELDSLDIDEVR